ncbi:DUF4010 domain-containing protein [Thiomonas sp. FB-6]|uniref:MgtC/SapB family protein n=1 Tax=Thiomonas sp. FB-6 TaxID=1158291 RepID=UPI0003720F3E|nr:DUF4010 domain-containing protein [Thiomonas sp. FB-6]
MDSSLGDLLHWVAALGAGLLIGVERERSHPDEQASAGLRSFALAALAGAAAASLGAAALVAVVLAVAALAVAGYLRSRDNDPGITTEIALLLCVLLGALAMRQAALSSALAVLVAVLLAAKARLHGFVRSVLSEQELQHGLLLAASALVVLPLLPNRALPALGGLNPHVLWTLAVLLMAIQTLGHVALRWLGPVRGLALTGLLGGFVSSTATIAAMARRAREHPGWFEACLAGALWSNVSTVVQLGVMTAVVAPGLLARLAPALLLAGAVTLAAGWWSARLARRGGQAAPAAAAVAGRPFSPRAALLFAAAVGAMLFVAEQAYRRFGGSGVLVATALAGLADAHSSSVSALQLHAGGALSAGLAAVCVGAAFSTNALSKTVAAASGGSARFTWLLAASQLAMVLGFWVGLASALWFPRVLTGGGA